MFSFKTTDPVYRNAPSQGSITVDSGATDRDAAFASIRRFIARTNRRRKVPSMRIRAPRHPNDLKDERVSA